MPIYTLVVATTDDVSQDALIKRVDGDNVAVTFCGPGSLVQTSIRGEDGDSLHVPVEFDGRKVEVQVHRRTEETGPLLRLVGVNCRLDGDGPGDYYLSAPD